MTRNFSERHLCLALIWLAGLLAGCDAFEYYGPIPNLRKIVDVSDRDLGRLESLRLRSRTVSLEAAREIRLATRLTCVTIEECQLEDGRKLMDSLGELPQLNSLTIHRSQLSDADFVGLESASQLSYVEILASDLHGDGLRSLCNLPIRSLIFESDSATAEDLQCLADFEHLEELYVRVPGLQLQHLPSLRKLQRLESVTFLKFDVPEHDQEQALGFLRGIPSLQRIHLSSYSIRDGLMRSLAELPSVEAIEILDNSITDEGICALEPLPNLRELTMWDARRITRDSLASISKHQQLEALDLCGALIAIRDRSLLECLPKLYAADVGLTNREIDEALAGGESLEYSPQTLERFRNSISRNAASRRQQMRPTLEGSM